MKLASFLRAIFPLLLVGSTLALRWSALDRQIWNLDEGSTITMAQQVLDGQVLFRDAADNRTPLVPYLKAVILALAGDWNVWAIHFSLAVMIGLTAVLLWLICRQLGHEATGVFSALAFLWLTTGLIPPVDSLCAHTGWFLIFFSALGFWCFSTALTHTSRRWAFASGTSFSLALLAKQPGLLDFGVTLIVVLILAVGRDQSRPWRLLPSMLGGMATPLVLTIAYFAANHAIADLKFYAWTYNTQYYVPEVPLSERLGAVRVPFQLLIERMPAALGLGASAAGGLLWIVFVRERRKPDRAVLAWLILGWAATGLLSTMLSGRDFTHYSIQVLPGASLACGWSMAWLWSRAGWFRWAGRVTVAAAMLSLIVPSIRSMASVDTSDGFGPSLGEAIRRHSRSDEQLFIWGYMPELYVFAQRLPSTRFIYTNWITGLIPWTNNDWLTDTAYAIIPGTSEQLQTDIEKNPPAIVVDTGRLRTYLKYPLYRQASLWPKILREYAQVELGVTEQTGFKIYRRMTEAGPALPFPAGVSVDASVRLESLPEWPAQDLRLVVHYPAGTRSLELYKDGELYRRLDLMNADKGAAAIHAPQADLSGEHHFQALVRGDKVLASPVTNVRGGVTTPVRLTGPMLEFGGREYAPLTATNIDGDMRRAPDESLWKAWAPTHIVYRRPPGLPGIEFEYKMADVLSAEPHRWHTDGVEVVVQFENSAGRRTELFRRRLDARYNPRDRGMQREQVSIPTDEPGLITLWISPGRASDASSDWVQLKAVRGLKAPVSLRFRNLELSPSRMDVTYDVLQAREGDLDISMVHAPSEIEFELHSGMRKLTGRYGLLSSAWTGPKGSAGATFEIWHLPTNSEPRRLLHAQLDPVREPQDREPQVLSLTLPAPAEGYIRLRTVAMHPQDNSFNHTYWAELAAEGSPPVITTAGAPLLPERVRAPYGHSEIEYQQRPVLFAHAPSEIICPVMPNVRQLAGFFGLIDAAYTSSEPTAGGRFVIESENTAGERTELWSRELDPQNRSEDRGFIPLSVAVDGTRVERVIFRTEARPGHGLNRAWTFWHDLRLDP